GAGGVGRQGHVRGSATIPGEGKDAVELAMDRATLAKHLEDAERQVAQGKDYLAKQEAFIGELAREGHGTAQARALLDTLL
ncbi:MAG: hypothetical protein ACJ8D4_17190, partial [Xanthobacteraceae bacterium]